MVHGNQLAGDYTGCSGPAVYSDIQNDILLRGVSGPARETAREGSYALQRLNPRGAGAAPPSPAETEPVLRSGALAEPATAELAARIRAALVNGRYEQRLRELIGNPGSHLVRTGIVAPVRHNAETLICSAMVELFLGSLENRLGRAWKGPQHASAFAR